MTAEKVDLLQVGSGFCLANDAPGALRVSRALFSRYEKALAAVRALELAITARAERPIYVTPDQEAAVRAATRPGAWVVVRDDLPVPLAMDAPLDAPVLPRAPDRPAPVVPAAPPVRPRPERCPERGGLPHANLRFVITEQMSVYDPGRIRIDGLCQCGHREPDVRCPHQKQKLNGANQKACAMCNAVLGSSAGAIDNRNLSWSGRSPSGAADPNIQLPVPAGAQDAPRDAYRAPGA